MARYWSGRVFTAVLIATAAFGFGLVAPAPAEPNASFAPSPPPVVFPDSAPWIVSASPADGETNVSVDAAVIVTFSEAMATSSTTGNFTPYAIMLPTWTGGDTVLALMSPAGSPLPPLARCTMYTVTIAGQDRDGNALVPGPVPNPFRFVTTCAGPAIVATSPADGETGVPRSASIVVTFGAPMDPATVTWSIVPRFPLIPSWDAPIDTALTLDSEVAPFDPCTRYTVEIEGSDRSGNPLLPGPVPNPWTFTTACEVPRFGLGVASLPPNPVPIPWRTSGDRFAIAPAAGVHFVVASDLGGPRRA